MSEHPENTDPGTTPTPQHFTTAAELEDRTWLPACSCGQSFAPQPHSHAALDVLAAHKRRAGGAA
jgi:hypothetical protein